MTDGLGLLEVQRQRRRTGPGPRNPPRSTPVAIATPAPIDPPQSGPAPADESHPAPESPQTATPPEPTVKMSVYLEPKDDLYLEQVTHAGKTGRPRVAISRSAVVRLALERLADATTIDEVVAELRRRGDHHQGSGRKRR